MTNVSEDEAGDFRHIPVMLNEVVDLLQIKPGMIVFDGTLGLGGHARVILERIVPDGKYIGVDQDESSLAVAKKNLDGFKDQCSFINSNFSRIDECLTGLGIQSVDAILVDLGISSYQLDQADRGFSLRFDGPLDMRMDKKIELSAYDLVNSFSEQEISLILKNYGEERWHQRIARNIVNQRSLRLIETTEELKGIVLRSMPNNRARQKLHPATRTFQALRIAVNHELESVETLLDKFIDYLSLGGRMAVISFHSLEDRLVKLKFKELMKQDRGAIITKKPLRPSEKEAGENPRSRSAKLRVIEKV